jgi:uncharacterized protein
MTFVRQTAMAAMVLLCGGVLGSSHAIAAGEQSCGLVDAASAGDLAKVKDCLIAGADVNAKNANGSTALMLAAQEGHLAVVQSLLAAKADVNLTAGSGNTALLLAAQEGHGDVVQALIAAGADINAKRGGGVTALMMAAQNGHTAVVQALLAAKADVSATAYGLTALALAEQHGHADIVQLLKAASATAAPPAPTNSSTQTSAPVEQKIVLNCSVGRTEVTLVLDLAAKTIIEDQSTPDPGATGPYRWHIEGTITEVTDGHISWTMTTQTSSKGQVLHDPTYSSLNRYTGLLSWTNTDTNTSGTTQCQRQQDMKKLF